ncbi:MAG TPA: FAD-dependent oxidoreductase [Planctomycetaceae bacterium]|nr:FAD-dependent oxidoreductase [Planctomycetaceae bacterium]
MKRVASAILSLAFPLLALPAGSRAAETVHADVVVYTATAGGATASIAAARQGANVILLEPGRHVGGMLSGGLGQSDVRGQRDLIGGLTTEVYRRMAAHYGKVRPHEAFNFEPHVAENTLRTMLHEAGVTVVHDQRLESITKHDGRIVSLTTTSGNTYVAKVFIDAGYEGDLMAAAGVEYTVGREGREKYGESLAGRTELLPGEHQFLFPVSARKDGKLLPLVTAQEDLVATGEGDGKFQAYCFRLCLTNQPENQLPIEQPEGYNPDDYEMLRRYFEVGGDRVRHPLHMPRVPNGKCDLNSTGPVSTNLLGAAWEYPDADHARRQEIWQQHLRWAQGLLWFLQNDPSVPEAHRNAARRWGLCKDEFVDTGGWPHQLYIREGRRMIGEYLVTQHDLQTRRTKPDAVCMCGYNIDLREVQWVAVRTFRYPRAEDELYTEGYVSQPVDPWQVPYRALTPKASQCKNLLVPVCASMSTIAFGSFRMEPGYMMAGHAAGLAAALAADANVAVQEVNVDQLQRLLREQGQVLETSDPAESEQ